MRARCRFEGRPQIHDFLWVQTAETCSEATDEKGTRHDGDLSHLFIGS